MDHPSFRGWLVSKKPYLQNYSAEKKELVSDVLEGFLNEKGWVP
jgi:hypothetical protein